jgi:hypothetical protein
MISFVNRLNIYDTHCFYTMSVISGRLGNGGEKDGDTEGRV